MNIWLFVTILAFNILALGVFLIIDRKTVHVMNSQVLILGSQNESLIKSPRITAIRIIYGLTMLALGVFSYFIFLEFFQ